MSARYGRVPVWQDLCFTVRGGRSARFTGENGTGKTTLAHCLYGLHKESAGKLYRNGKAVKARACREKGFLIMQNVNFQLFGDSVLNKARLGNDATEEEAVNVLEAMDLARWRECHPMALSGGQKQRLAIAGGCLCVKERLIFDEPTSGLDYLHMRWVSETLRALVVSGQSVPVVTHDAEFLQESGAYILPWAGRGKTETLKTLCAL